MSQFTAHLRCLLASTMTMLLVPHAVAGINDTRSVRVLDGPATPAPPPAPTTAPSTAAPQDAAPEIPPPATAPPTPPAQGNAGLVAPSPAHGPTSPAAGDRPRLSAIAANDVAAAKVSNPAEVAIEMLPSQTVKVGSRVSFRVSSRKSGYLVLVDVDATGKLTQIYPSTAVVMQSRAVGNYIKAGSAMAIPLPTDSQGAMEYVVSPPLGPAMVVAILSPRPVQILDLPDVPADVTSQSEALAFLTKWTAELRIPDGDNSPLRETKWSFNAKPYTIQ